MLLADALTELEFLRGLSQNWPFLATFLGAMWWFATQIAKPLTARHLSWMDAQEQREKERTLADERHQNTLNTVHEKVNSLDQKTTLIKEIVSRVPMQPNGGG